jgi:hypothetical protein
VAKKEQRVDNVGVGAAAVFLPMVVVVAAAATRGRLEVAAAAANNIIISVSLSLRPKKDELNINLPRYDIIYLLVQLGATTVLIRRLEGDSWGVIEM